MLDGMVEMGTLTQAEADEAKLKLPKFPKIRSESQYGGQKGHMLRLVRNELLQLGYQESEIDGGGLRITTTFTPEAMAAAKDGEEAQRPEGFGKNLHVAVASVETGTGALRGFFGGQDFLKSEINWASAGGMAGSTFKAFAVATGLTEGFSLKDTFDGNSPYELPDGVNEIENQGNQSYGAAIPLLRATENSVNTAFVDMTLGMKEGPEKIIATAEAMGIPANAPEGSDFGIPRASIDIQPVAGVALGSGQVSPINMANAYATIANGGEAAPVHVIERVVERSGEESYRFKVSTERAIGEDIAADTSYALQQVVKSGSGTAALALGRPAAGKTGTATNGAGEVSSSWFVGYTPQMATAVMYVRGQGREQLEGWLPEFFGGSYPARTWTDVMERLMDGVEVEEFPPAANVDGDAPDEGHEPPPPEPPKPTKTEETETPEPTPDTDAHADPDAHADSDAHSDSDARRRHRPSLRHHAVGDSWPMNADRVHPTLDDPVVAGLSEGVGGPVGSRAGRHPWWTPTRVVLILAALCFCLGMVQKAPCFNDGWRDSTQRYSEMCYSDLPYLYTGRGLAELSWPYSEDSGIRARHQVMEYPVGISYWAWGTAWVTHWLAGSPDIDARYDVAPDQVFAEPGVLRETKIFVIVNAAGFALMTLLAAYLLSLVNPGRPWDAVFFAASPTLALTGLINWDLVAVAFVAAALWAWSRDKPVLTGVMIGLGAATKLYPLFLIGALLVICLRQRRVMDFLQAASATIVAWVLANAPAYLTGPDQWDVFWSFNSDRGADLGSVWLAISQSLTVSVDPQMINQWSLTFFVAWCVGVLALGLAAPIPPRLAQLGFLIVAGFLLVNKVYSPQYVLWLLPLAALARPRLRDQLIWQSSEIFYFMAVWWYLGGFIAPAAGGDPPLYWLAIVIRMLGEFYLIAIVARDVMVPSLDPVSRDDSRVEPAHGHAHRSGHSSGHNVTSGSHAS